LLPGDCEWLTSRIAAVSVIGGVLVITWMTISCITIGGRSVWPQAWQSFRSPWHEMTAGVVGTIVIVVLAWVLGILWRRQLAWEPSVRSAAASAGESAPRAPRAAVRD
jgi:hypothetical protein